MADPQPISHPAISRRTFLRHMAVLSCWCVLPGAALLGCVHAPARQPPRNDDLTLPVGYRYEVLVRWGDPVLPGAPAFNSQQQHANRQSKQFGYNCDYVGWLPIVGVDDDRALLVVNHEYSLPALMFPDFGTVDPARQREQIDVEWAARGLSVVEIRRRAGLWEVAGDSSYNRRVSVTTSVRLSGPAAGHPWLRTTADPAGNMVRGTLGNCGGGITPWGTVLSCEEGFQYAFDGQAGPHVDPRIHALHREYQVPKMSSGPVWSLGDARFSLAREPHEPLRYGWVVEVNPYDPLSTPVKRTALGRMEHEFAVVRADEQGRVVAYTNDDGLGGSVYKFVSDLRMKSNDAAHNARLLDHGTLYAAKFHDDGTGTWLPLAHGAGGLDVAHGFHSLADILINTRAAARVVGATGLERPEGMAVDSDTGHLFVAVTGREGAFGHVLELREHADNIAGRTFSWSVLANGTDQSLATSAVFAKPDNVCVDGTGYLWIGSDGQREVGYDADGIYVAALRGEHRGQVRRVATCPKGSEATGLTFSPDRRTLFVSVQHPGFGPGATFQAPLNRWPDHHASMPPRPSVVAISRDDGEPMSGAEFFARPLS